MFAQSIQQRRRRSVETALRFLEEFCDSTSIHGFSYLLRRKRHCLEYTFWLLTIIFMISVSIYLSVDLIAQYKRENIAVTVDTDFSRLNSTMPSFTFCPRVELSNVQLDSYIREHDVGSDVSRDDLKYFLQQLILMTISTIKPIKDLNYGLSPNDYMELVFNYSQIYRTERFMKYADKTVSDIGICYTSSNFLIINSTPSIHWNDQTNDSKSQNPISKLQTFSFFDEPDYVTFAHAIPYLDTYIHSPYEMPTTWTRPIRDSHPKKSLLVEFTSADITVDKDLISGTTIEQRQCRTNEESNLLMFPKTYSRNLCLMDCRAQFALRNCHCLPHFYDRIEFRKTHPMEICDVKGLNCLANYTEILRNLESSKDGMMNCSCLPNCNLMEIRTEITSKRLNFDPGNVIKFFHSLPRHSPRIQYKRNIIFTNLDFAVAIGNVFGVFMGCCVLSFIEVFYFFSLRLFWFRRGYRGAVQWIRD